MVSKTRDKLIEVARQLFFYKGVENTTMNDIATASDKGRRTIYTYFKNKREIYNAVVESQSNSIIDRLNKIVESDISYSDKLYKYLRTRIETIIEISPVSKSPYDKYKSFFSRETRRYDKVSEVEKSKEHSILSQLLNDGVAAGIFVAEQAKTLPSLLTLIFLSIENLFLNNTKDQIADIRDVCDNAINFVMSGILVENTLYKLE